MAQKKKLQVFISSTYLDLLDERQAAVEAILTAGHIPAGMELFTAGDESQMDVIKRWIDDSDIYLLILGGRYGSLDPKSEKSYTQLEYEYALEKGKPLFSVVINEDYLEKKVKKHGSAVIEKDHPQKLKSFRALVLTQMVKFWSDPRDIKLSILETIAEFSWRADLTGWIPGNEAVDTGALAEEIARLAKENAALREQVLRLSATSVTYNGLSYEQMYKLLVSSQATIPQLADLGEENITMLEKVAEIFGDPEPRLLHALWILNRQFRPDGYIPHENTPDINIAWKLESFGLLEKKEEESARAKRGDVFKLTDDAKRFLIRLSLELNTEEADKFVLER
jgi:hypothetical protein